MYRFRRSAVEVIVIVLVLCSALWAQEVQSVHPPSIEMYRPTVMPDRITLTVAEDPATSVGLTWRTSDSVKDAVAQIVVANPGPKFEDQAQTIPAVTSEFSCGLWKANNHSVVFRGLKPNTVYSYRVGDKNNWSEWLQFRTASDKLEPFCFLYFGDPQTGLRTVWPRALREAYKTAPDAKFMALAGDLVNIGTEDNLWGQFFEAGAWLYGMLPMLPSPGNHEYYTDKEGNRVITPNWRSQFTLPENGPEKLKEYTYYIDCQGMRIISLTSNELVEEQAVWLENLLANNPNKWTVLIFHHPVFSTARGRDNTAVREIWEPLFAKYKVDLVLTGHDHTYARSGMENSTMYAVSVSGGKMYGVERKPWMVRAAENTQLFQVITIDGDKLTYESRTATGSLYDAFELYKQAGQTNRLVEKVPADVPERLPVQAK